MQRDVATPATALPRASVVIPAHDEARVLARCLAPLTELAASNALEIVVICNGCTDSTEQLARELLGATAHSRVESLAEPSKIAALQAGDTLATAYPRVYLDADVQVSAAVLDELVDLLSSCRTPAVAAPRLRVDASAASSAVQRYYRVWSRLPYVADGIIGSGIYAVNAAGGERIGAFPDVVNDDGWVRGRFAADERLQTQGSFTVFAPRTAAALIARRARIARGNAELSGLDALEPSPGPRAVLALVRSRSVSIIDAGYFVCLTLAARRVAARARRRSHTVAWSRDDTSRDITSENIASANITSEDIAPSAVESRP